MCGRATLAMLVSSTSMNAASETAAPMIQGLPWPHVGKLRFLKVGRNPDIVERHYFYQFLPDGDVLAHFDCPLTNNSCDWRANDCIAEVEVCLIELCFAFSRLGFGCVGLGDHHRNLLRCG